MFQLLAASVLRHAATAGGVWLAKEGFIDADTTQQVTGCLVTVGGLGWSFVEKMARNAF